MILNKSLWEQSGHWDHYKENMYFTEIDKQEYGIKPMNCPGHIMIYNSKSYSYKELPIRFDREGCKIIYEGKTYDGEIALEIKDVR